MIRIKSMLILAMMATVHGLCAQVFEKEFKADSVSKHGIAVVAGLKFHNDSSFQFSGRMYQATEKYAGTYTFSAGQILLSWTDSLGQNRHKVLLYDSDYDRIIDPQSMVRYSSFSPEELPRKKVQVITVLSSGDTLAADTFSVPVLPGQPVVTMDVLINHVSDFDCLRYAIFNLPATDLFHDDSYDTYGRLKQYYYSGWKNMSSFASYALISYAGNSRQIKTITKINEAEYQQEGGPPVFLFTYDQAGNIVQVDFYKQDKLTQSLHFIP